MKFNNNYQKMISPMDRQRLDIIEMRRQVIETLRRNDVYNYSSGSAINAYQHEIKAAVRALWFYVKAAAQAQDELSIINQMLTKSDLKSFLQAYEIIDTWLHEKGLTEWIRRLDYDTTDVEAENEAKGL